MRYAEVALPIPLGRAFSYAVPAQLEGGVVPGARVVCELGKRRVLGVVLAVSPHAPAFDSARIKPISALVDARPVVGDELLGFLRALASYYFAPIGEVLRLALPAVEREDARKLEESGLFEGGAVRVVGGRRVLFARAAVDAPAGAKVPRGSAGEILERLRASGEERVLDLELSWKSARVALRKLETAGLVALVQREDAAGPFFGAPVARDAAPDLNPPQREATDALVAALDERASRAFLLHGVTGSGKTEVYLHAIDACLRAGRGALVLVPEIALTPQLVGRFRARFGDELSVLHSGLGDRERHAMWRELREGRVHVAIGARSALFSPIERLGLVVVDEEHDPSFKQEEGVRYHARDMAMLRAHRAGAVVVLGSATPSLETEALARGGKVTRLVLPDRAHAAAVLPKVEIVDLRRVGPGPTGDKRISLPLHRALERTLAEGGQAILFLNRRGFAPTVICDACGEVVSCPSCSVALTFHRARGGSLRCHYCDHGAAMPDACPACGARALVLEGLGTEKLEETIAAAFPGARVARLDRDVASGAKAEAVLERVRRREVDVLVGTQMVTKGHDLPGVTLVGVINADAATTQPEFRAAERAFHLLVQVAGRAGRGDSPGTVIVQTRDVEHPAIVHALHHDVEGFVAHELEARRDLGYPPHSKLALVRVDAVDADRTRAYAERLASVARACPPVRAGDVDVLGPAPAPLERLRGRYRYRVMLRAKDRASLRAVLARVADELTRGQGDRHVRAAIDVDPVQMS